MELSALSSFFVPHPKSCVGGQCCHMSEQCLANISVLMSMVFSVLLCIPYSGSAGDKAILVPGITLGPMPSTRESHLSKSFLRPRKWGKENPRSNELRNWLFVKLC